MQISKIHYFTTFSSRYNNSGRKNTFRDEELFDSEKDYVTESYRQYSYDDLPYEVYSPYIIDYDYARDNNITPILRKINRITACSDADDITELPNETEIVLTDDMLKACMLEGEEGMRFSGSLYNYILDKTENSNKISPEAIVEICNSAKLKKHRHEYVDYNLLNAGLFCYNKLANRNVEDTKRLMQALIIEDSKGNEDFSMNAFEFIRSSKLSIIHNNIPVEKQIEAIEAGYIYNKSGIVIGFSQNKAFAELRK